jgi:hypothetical protein
LDLSFLTVPFPLDFSDCRFHLIFIQDAQVLDLDFSGSWVTGIKGDGITVTKSVNLSDGFRTDGQVSFMGATVGGDFDCTGGQFNNPKGYALELDRIDVKGDVFLRDDFSASGEVGLAGATIGGGLNCEGGTFSNPTGDALNADSIDVRGNVFLRDGFRGIGLVRMVGGRLAAIWIAGQGPSTMPGGSPWTLRTFG